MSARKDGTAAKSGGGTGRRKGDNRTSPRVRKRLMVRYGVEAADKTAFTQNLSETGLYIKTNGVIKPGTTIQVEIHTPEKTFSQWARVIWAKRVPAQLAHILDCGMGVRFIQPSPEWIEFCRQWQAKS